MNHWQDGQCAASDNETGMPQPHISSPKVIHASPKKRPAREVRPGTRQRQDGGKAYVDAGYKANRHNAAALAREQHILTRLQALQLKAAEKAGVTVQSLTDELEEARGIAIAEKQSSAAVAATLGKSKLHELLIEKKQHSGPNGGAIPIDLTNVSDDQLAALKAIFGPLAGGAGDDDEGDQGGGGEAAG